MVPGSPVSKENLRAAYSSSTSSWGVIKFIALRKRVLRSSGLFQGRTGHQVDEFLSHASDGVTAIDVGRVDGGTHRCDRAGVGVSRATIVVGNAEVVFSFMWKGQSCCGKAHGLVGSGGPLRSLCAMCRGALCAVGMMVCAGF